MIGVNDLKNGLTIKYNGTLYQVMEFQHVKPEHFGMSHVAVFFAL